MSRDGWRDRLAYAARTATALVAFAALAGCGSAGLPAARSSAPVENSGPGDCPSAYIPRPTGVPADGALVPTGAKAAILCTYPFGTQHPDESYDLGATNPAADAVVASLVDQLNSLDHPASAVAGCTMLGHDQYQILLRYPDGGHVLVSLHYNCGTAEANGSLRRVQSMASLLSVWS